MELKYTKSNSGWPIEAASSGFQFTFSGVFSARRVRKERLARWIGAASKILLGLLLAGGAMGLGLNAYLAGENRDARLLLSHNPYNLLAGLGAFSACFLWAKFKQENLAKRTLNPLNFSAAAGEKNARVDVYSLFNPDGKAVWNKAVMLALSRQAAAVSALDLFLALMEDKSVKMAFFRLEVNAEDLQTYIKNSEPLEQNGQNELDELPFMAFAESLKLHNRSIDPLMLMCALAALLPKEHIISTIFFNLDLNLEKLEIVASWIFNLKLLSEDYRLFKKLSKFKPENEINRGLTSVPTRFLDRFSQDLTRLAKHGALPLALGRAPDLNEIFRLTNQLNVNIIIKGLEGSGRSTVIYELAYKMATEQVPKIWQDKRLVRLELAAIVGSPQKSENAFVQALREAEAAGNIILVLEEIHALAKIQGGSGLSLLETLINFLQESRLTVIGTTTLEDYTDYLQNAPNFESIFTAYELLSLSKSGILLACCVRASLLEGHNRCFFTYRAIEQAVMLTDLYIRGLSQPQKAVAILVEAASIAKNSSRRIITEKNIQDLVSKKTHIPAQTFTGNEAEKLLHLEAELGKYIVGQTAAVSAVAEGLRRARSGLGETSRPLASFLFLGPTGVGKTEIAKTLARVYFGNPLNYTQSRSRRGKTSEAEPNIGDDSSAANTGETYLLRLDMSEYRGAEGITKLLGSAESKADTQLIKHLKNYPFCLLLADEFEKASPEIINLFLQILEDGRLTSGRGELLDLTHCLIIATSNAGAREIQAGINAQKTLEQIKLELVSRFLTNIFPPELLNRFDGIVLFSPLSPNEVQRITYLQLQYLSAKLKDKGIEINFSPALVADIAAKAFDPLLGARPIRRYIQDRVEGFVAKLLLSKQLDHGSVATIGIQNGQLTIQ